MLATVFRGEVVIFNAHGNSPPFRIRGSIFLNVDAGLNREGHVFNNFVVTAAVVNSKPNVMATAVRIKPAGLAVRGNDL
jgi:hypothetical protein